MTIPVLGSSTRMADRDLRRHLYIATLLALYLPPFVGGTLMGIAGYYPMPQFYLIFISYAGIYVFAVSIFALKMTHRAICHLTAPALLVDGAHADKTFRTLRRGLWWALLGVSVYSLFGALSANFSLVQLGVKNSFTLAEHLHTILGLIPVVLITTFPIYFYINDAVGRYLAQRGALTMIAPLSSKLLVLGLFTPILIDTLLISYFANRSGSLESDLLLLWFGMVAVAGVGTWLAWNSIKQGMQPLRDFIDSALAAKGKPIRLTPQSLDEMGLITGQLQKQLEALRRLQALVEATPDLIAVADPTGQFSYMNAGGRRMIGLASDFDVTTTHIYDYHDHETAARILKVVLPACLQHGYWEGENTFRRRDGTSFLGSQVIMTHQDEAGNINAISTVTRDLSDRIRMENAIIDSDKKHRALIENLTDLILILDKDGNNLWNSSSVMNYGVRPEVTIGRNAFEYAHPDDAQRLSEAFGYVVSHPGETLKLPALKLQPPGKKVGYFDTSFTYLPDTPGIHGLVCVAHDVSEAKYAEQSLNMLNAELEVRVEERTLELKRINSKLEQSLSDLQYAQQQMVQSEKMAALGGLVAGVAHEINTPVGIGVTAASHLQMTVRDASERFRAGQLTRREMDDFLRNTTEASEMVLSNLRRAASIISSFKRVAVDQTSADRRQFWIKNYLDEVLVSISPILKRTRHSVKIECPDELRMLSHPGAFSQIVTNLVMNSITHGFEGMEAGCIAIRISVQPEDLLLRYTDDGKGIAPEHLEKIFNPFFTTKRGQGGSGLGLHIVYNLVTQMLGGSVTCKSAPGAGVCFEIRIPRAQWACVEPAKHIKSSEIISA